MKNRDNLYLVVREVLSRQKGKPIGSICGAYSSVEAADEKAAAYNQLWKDKGWTERDDLFSVVITTYYDH